MKNSQEINRINKSRTLKSDLAVEVVYFDHETEITDAIQVIRHNAAKEIRLVIPNKSNLMQSLINLKLLKKASDENNKQVILVTNDKQSIKFAAEAGLLVAEAVKSSSYDPKSTLPAKSKPAESSYGGKKLFSDDEVELSKEDVDSKEPEMEVESEVEELISILGEQDLKSQPKSETKSEQKNVGHGPDLASEKPSPDLSEAQLPDSRKMQKWLILGLVGIISFAVMLFIVNILPNATITLTSKAEKLNLDQVLTFSTTSSDFDYVKNIYPSKTLTYLAEASGEIVATGSKDNGTKATGNLKFRNCADTNAHVVQANTKVLAANGKVFYTDEAYTIPAGTFNGGGTNCTSSQYTVSVTASENGDSYNLTNNSYQIVNLPDDIEGAGSTTGGTSKIDKVIAQSDIDEARNKLIEQNKSKALEDIKKQAANYTILEGSYDANSDGLSSSVTVGQQIDKGTISGKIRFTEIAVSNDDLLAITKRLSELVPNFKDRDIVELNNEAITLDQVNLITPEQTASVNLKAVVYLADKIDENGLKQKVKSKSIIDAKNLIADTYPGIEVEIEKKPKFFALISSKMPRFASKIKIVRTVLK